MNYDEARQLGADSDSPGKWNWTTMNDGRIRTASPCAWPDYDWSSVPVEVILAGTASPTGRERCDHDTREAAERHQYDAALAKMTIDRLELDDIRARRRCDAPGDDGKGCREWESWRANWHDGYRFDHLCDDHADRATVALIHPFVPGIRSMHS